MTFAELKKRINEVSADEQRIVEISDEELKTILEELGVKVKAMEREQIIFETLNNPVKAILSCKEHGSMSNATYNIYAVLWVLSHPISTATGLMVDGVCAGINAGIKGIKNIGNFISKKEV